MKVVQTQTFDNLIWTDFDNGSTAKSLKQDDGSYIHTYFDCNGKEITKEEMWSK